MSTLVPTPEQQIIIDSIRQPESQLISAYAGCAKTSTLQMAGQKVRVPALALAFNKSIAKELEGRLPSNFTVRSLNALGFQAWKRSRPGVTMTVDGQKLGKLVTQTSKDRGVRLGQDQWDQLRKMVTGAMGIGLTPKSIGDPLVQDETANWLDIASAAWIPRDDAEFLIDLARDVLERSVVLAEQGVMSFDDQIYCPIVLGGKWLEFPVIFGDEAQDWNAMNHRMIELSMRRDGTTKLVVCGDPKQAIYAFRGALSDSMSKIVQLSEGWLYQSLTQTFRCPTAVVERQQSHAPGYTAAPTNPPGAVVRLANGSSDTEDSWSFPELESHLPTPDSPIAVLCRNNAPLLSLAFKLLRQRISVVMIGRDIGKGLKSLSKKLAKEDTTSAEIVREAVLDWIKSETQLALANKEDETKLDSITDRGECLLAVLGSAGVLDAGGLRAALDSLFARESGRVTLSTIHKAKGLEWPAVVHLDPWRIPSKQALAAKARGNLVPLEQENNMQYVCETRTQHTLILANLEDFE